MSSSSLSHRQCTDGPISGKKSSGDDSWFAGKMSRAKAEKILENTPSGTFLLRESDTRPVCIVLHCTVPALILPQGDYSLSVKYIQVKHIKINRNGNMYDIAPDAKAFPTIQVRSTNVFEMILPSCDD